MNNNQEFEIAGIYNKSLKCLLAIAIILFSVFYKNISYALGFSLGGITCLLNLRLMIKSLEGMVDNRTYSKAFFNGHYLLRLLLVTAVLASAIILESINLLTTVAGILTLRMVITWEAILGNNKGKKVWSD